MTPEQPSSNGDGGRLITPDEIQLLIQLVVDKEGTLYVEYPKDRPTDCLQVMGDAIKHIAIETGKKYGNRAKIMVPTAEQAQNLLRADG